MHEGFDDRGFPLAWETPPQRIVSLVPSLTETLVDLGAEEQIVGVTRFCHPITRKEKTRVGGTKGVKVDVIGSPTGSGDCQPRGKRRPGYHGPRNCRVPC